MNVKKRSNRKRMKAWLDQIHFYEHPKDAKFSKLNITERWEDYIRQQLNVSEVWEVYKESFSHREKFIATLSEEEKRELERVNFEYISHPTEIIKKWLIEKQRPVEVIEKRSRHIPTQVKREVWRRDEGRCAECGSQNRLEYDHIIPFSKGGSNTARNIQLLCEKCNRKKHDKIE